MVLCIRLNRDAGHGRKGCACVMSWPKDGLEMLPIDRPLMTYEEGPAYGRAMLKMWNEAGDAVEVLS